jgi:hypothetical protein
MRRVRSKGLNGKLLSAQGGQGTLLEEEIGKALALRFIAVAHIAQIQQHFFIAVLGHFLEARCDLIYSGWSQHHRLQIHGGGGRDRTADLRVMNPSL